VPAAYSNDREKNCDFTNEDLFIIWAEIYRPEKSKITTIEDLKGKNIAVVKGAQANKELVILLDGFGVTSKLIEHKDYSDVLHSIEKFDCDVGIGI
jgi:ABC-type amino acid transport substrate-binding protein